MTKSLPFLFVLLLMVTAPGHAQVVVHDPSVTLRNAVTAVLKEHLLNLQIAQYSQLRRWAQRLSMFTDLRTFGAEDPPKWRTHPHGDGEEAGVSDAFQVALDFGDAAGAGYQSVTESIESPDAALRTLPLAARRVLEQQLSTIDLTDAVSLATIHNSGRLRFAGRAELRAIDALDADVTDGSLEQSATAVLDKISGAALIGARQRQARTELLIGLVEQMVADTKRERDTHAAALNMQLAQWKRRQLTEGRVSTVAGQALATWRQP